MRQMDVLGKLTTERKLKYPHAGELKLTHDFFHIRCDDSQILGNDA